MNKAIPAITIGIDLGDKKHAICVLDRSSEILEQRAITNNYFPNNYFPDK